MNRLVRRLGAWLLIATLGSLVIGAARPTPSLILEPKVTATELFLWEFTIRVANPLTTGIYTDSLVVEVEDLDPGETRTERVHRRNLGSVSHLLASVSRRDTAQFRYLGGATAERARLRLHLYVRDQKGKPYVATGTTETAPNNNGAFCRSQFLDDNGRRVEYLIVPPYRTVPSSPAILLVHGHASHARLLIELACTLAEKQYTVMAVSQPGYGQSTGPADFMGPATVSALEKAYDVLARTPGVDSTRLAVWGMSRGATAAMLLAARRPSLAAVVAQSGIYDLWGTYRGTRLPGFRETIVSEAGTDSAAWAERSPILAVDKIRSAVLLLHGRLDTNVPVEQVGDFGARLHQSGARMRVGIFSEEGHHLPREPVERTVLEFLDFVLRSPADSTRSSP